MKILVVEPLMPPYAKDINGNLESMQKIVGGTIQAIYPFKDPNIALICNDDGKLINLPFNRRLRKSEGEIDDIIAGTFFLCSAKPNDDKFEGLTDEKIKTYTGRFSKLEIFVRR